MANPLLSAVDKHRDRILAAQDYIWANPETGYREVKTGRYMEQQFEELGYQITRADNIPGFYTVIDTGRPGPELLVLGELDALLCAEHPAADPETGAVHCCGHSAQCAALVGIAAALKEPGVLDALSGRIRLCAVPAEELIEIEYRSTLKEQGIIRYFGGKSEFLHRGYFDGVDLALMVHTTNGPNFIVQNGSVGCMAKRIVYKGVSAHAGGSPWLGRNALYAATQGLSAINAIRETFSEPDIIRVHPIITKGGGAVNAIPDHVIIESYVRGKSFQGIERANRKVNRALCGAALSLGTNVDIQDTPGYAPLVNSPEMMQVAIEAAAAFPDVPLHNTHGTSSGSTDMGDLSSIMPVVHPYAPGAVGAGHGIDYFISDPELACVTSAKWQLEMVRILLSEGAARAKAVVEAYQAPFASKEDYFAYVDGQACKGDRIQYQEGSATVIL